MSRDQTLNRPLSSDSGMRRRIRMLIFIIVCLLIWAGITVWDQSGKLNDKTGKMNALLVQKTAVEQTKATMIKEVARLNDPEYREEIMRTQLNLGKSGETTFELPKTNP
ncbi:septum formation initiator family protein [Paenibacillus psychroresistens]|uniref:Septum formation initiator family protein n=1 Tax=Paenibacillus psychroresistens TaxID=1778678 RepID=A0A6B8RCB3_9BACL|nr:septum formation initiator family protein [Paenibacillus psychroresistens]QGQ93697.1 septum formation initiator family protein [Paenibacillus psychroresistens]